MVHLASAPSLLGRLQAFISPQADPATEAAQGTVAAVYADLPEAFAVALIELPSGRPLAWRSRLPGLRPERAAAYNAEVVRQKHAALLALGLGHERIEDILISLREQLHLLRVSRDGSRLLYVAVDSDDSNLALTRHVLRQHIS
ncbi:hypothetical protein LJ737_20330 [Hymenobacter sp. 15J16-1T3B]|uniref:hypothetical protein n=1 Tax=Hymenobacter sp. 15J16-1T3B TaxID=2886941 RepID=UPI001D12ADBB|nr:hypothetical protein [Hymenobacter sp. 15J16-1T3B]MCC3159600.1 hypothetical protein [Hymenobacter sp. 15J16-1T3B]